MIIHRDEGGYRFVQIGKYRAYPKGGGYWDIVDEDLVAAWCTKNAVRAFLKGEKHGQ